jgi:probable F420-dependent oxidoreductase
LGPDAWLCVEQKICLTTDAAAARGIAANVLSLYLPWPNYRNNWLSLGFTEEELSGRGSDRFLDSMVAFGSAEEVRARLQAHFDAGADHVCVQPLNADGSGLVDWAALEAVAGL